eukprot:Gb_06093 [translate_table: standard]
MRWRNECQSQNSEKYIQAGVYNNQAVNLDGEEVERVFQNKHDEGGPDSIAFVATAVGIRMLSNRWTSFENGLNLLKHMLHRYLNADKPNRPYPCVILVSVGHRKRQLGVHIIVADAWLDWWQGEENHGVQNGNVSDLKNFDDDGHIRRKGTIWTASAHIITAVIGSGVLSLAWAIAQLGWVAGPGVLIAFSFVTLYTSALLADCYRSPVTGKRNHTYMDAVKANLGGLQILLCGITQYAILYGTAIGYTITASISMAAIRRSNCFHENGMHAACHTSNNPFMIFFGIVQIILSQIPDFDRIWWLSIVAAVMSFAYATIGLGLGIAKVAEGNVHVDRGRRDSCRYLPLFDFCDEKQDSIAFVATAVGIRMLSNRWTSFENGLNLLKHMLHRYLNADKPNRPYPCVILVSVGHRKRQLGVHIIVADAWLDWWQGEENHGVQNGNVSDLKNFDDDGHIRRKGTIWTASAHIITAVIGSGVLSLAWAIAQLGWVAGPGVLIAFSFVTLYTSALLADCYRSPVTGKRNHTYMDAVKANLGGLQILLCGITQYAILYGTAIGYTITASISMAAIRRSNCFHENGMHAACHTSNNPFMIFFGIVQIILSQIPDFDRIWWLSIVAAVMSFAYATIGLGLGIAKVAEGNVHGSLTGVTVGTITEGQKVWRTFQALGDIAFAYSFSMILIEIQNTLKSPPQENKTMKKATLIGVTTTTVFYMLCGCIGYAAFGDKAPGNLLTGFGFYKPYWLIDFANVCIVVHLVGAYQVFTQPLFAFIENWVSHVWPKSTFIHKNYSINIPLYGLYKLNLFGLVWRTCFVITTTIISMLLPFFNDVLALLGAIAFWPLTVYFPTEMYIVQKKIKRLTNKWVFLQTLSIVCLLVSLAAACGSIEGILQDLKKYRPFKTTP